MVALPSSPVAPTTNRDPVLSKDTDLPNLSALVRELMSKSLFPVYPFPIRPISVAFVKSPSSNLYKYTSPESVDSSLNPSPFLAPTAIKVASSLIVTSVPKLSAVIKFASLTLFVVAAS